MNQKHTTREIEVALQYYKAGIPVTSIVLDTGIPRSTIYGWIKKASVPEQCKKAISQKDYRLLENKVVRLEGIPEVLAVQCL